MPILITSKEIEELPMDPRQRFVYIEDICRSRLEKLLENEDDVNKINKLKLQYAGTLISSAKYLKISPINDMELPSANNIGGYGYSNDFNFEDFMNDIDFYITQLALEAADINQKLSIVLQGDTRSRISTLTHHLREQIGNLKLSKEKINELLKLISDFESALEKPRLTFSAVAAMAFIIIGAIADLDGATDAIKKLVVDIEVIVGQAKIEQDTNPTALLNYQETRKIAAPRGDSETED